MHACKCTSLFKKVCFSVEMLVIRDNRGGEAGGVLGSEVTAGGQGQPLLLLAHILIKCN